MIEGYSFGKGTVLPRHESTASAPHIPPFESPGLPFYSPGPCRVQLGREIRVLGRAETEGALLPGRLLSGNQIGGC